MKNYIFTQLERQTLQNWLEGKARPKLVDVIFARIRRAERLEEDMRLYRAVKREMKRRGLKL